MLNNGVVPAANEIKKPFNPMPQHNMPQPQYSGSKNLGRLAFTQNNFYNHKNPHLFNAQVTYGGAGPNQGSINIR